MITAPEPDNPGLSLTYTRYGLLGTASLLLNLLSTKMFYRKSRLIRRPLDLRNRRYIDLGTNLTTGKACRFEAHPEKDCEEPVIVFGNGVRCGDHVQIAGRKRIAIGDDVLIASKSFITDLNHGQYSGPGAHSAPGDIPRNRALHGAPVTIGNRVWIGHGVAVLPGVTIGEGCIIGALAVVTRDLPPNSIAVGMPARVIKRYDHVSRKWVVV